MRVVLDITPSANGAPLVQAALATARERLAAHRILLPVAPGKRDHVRLAMAAGPTNRPCAWRHARGYAPAGKQDRLRDELLKALSTEISEARPDVLLLTSATLAGTLARAENMIRLQEVLARFSEHVEVVARIDEPARALARAYAEQVRLGRTASLDQEMELASSADWQTSVLALREAQDASRHRFPEIQAPPAWLDPTAFATLWDTSFAALRLRRFDASRLAPGLIVQELSETYNLPAAAFPEDAPRPNPEPSAQTVARMRALNPLLEAALARGWSLSRGQRLNLLDDLDIPGPPIAPGSLAAVSQRFAPELRALALRHPDLDALHPPPPLAPWAEADVSEGFRATQYLAAVLPRLKPPEKAVPKPKPASAVETVMASLAGGRFAPRCDPDPPEPDAPFPDLPALATSEQQPGTAIVACMKNEAPYVLEWIAFHRAIGVDRILIYSNGCEDGTDALLDRLQAMGVVQHRRNDDWKGASPQQHALNLALSEPVVEDADWIAHVDVDEFINIRTGNGTLADLRAQVPAATNVAMTWRLFGHDGVSAFQDRPVIEQFTRAAPRHCPKPHTSWGFKTLFRNIGAYAKMSCHRPNKLDPAFRDRVYWVNGSGQPMGEAIKSKGWRSDLQTVGYDLVQLNHYPLRSAESFLIKRERGRALHVDRDIGYNYWLRMDWCDATDLSIRRHLPRTRAGISRLMQDSGLACLHRAAVDWHRTKAAELRADPQFADLYRAVTALKLSPLERAAHALTLDMER